MNQQVLGFFGCLFCLTVVFCTFALYFFFLPYEIGFIESNGINIGTYHTNAPISFNIYCDDTFTGAGSRLCECLSGINQGEDISKLHYTDNKSYWIATCVFIVLTAALLCLILSYLCFLTFDNNDCDMCNSEAVDNNDDRVTKTVWGVLLMSCIGWIIVTGLSFNVAGKTNSRNGMKSILGNFIAAHENDLMQCNIDPSSISIIPNNGRSVGVTLFFVLLLFFNICGFFIIWMFVKKKIDWKSYGYQLILVTVLVIFGFTTGLQLSI